MGRRPVGETAIFRIDEVGETRIERALVVLEPLGVGGGELRDGPADRREVLPPVTDVEDRALREARLGVGQRRLVALDLLVGEAQPSLIRQAADHQLRVGRREGEAADAEEGRGRHRRAERESPAAFLGARRRIAEMRGRRPGAVENGARGAGDALERCVGSVVAPGAEVRRLPLPEEQRLIRRLELHLNELARVIGDARLDLHFRALVWMDGGARPAHDHAASLVERRSDLGLPGRARWNLLIPPDMKAFGAQRRDQLLDA